MFKLGREVLGISSNLLYKH